MEPIWKAEYLCQPRVPMDLTPGSRDWIKQAQEKMAQSEGAKARALEREKEAIRAAVAYQQEMAEKALDDERKAAAEERRRRQMEEETQRTDWDIL